MLNTSFPVLKSGVLEARLAMTAAEIEEAQRLRFSVFYEECGAKSGKEIALEKRDFDDFDTYCNHLIVIDKSNNKIVGTYRLLLRENAKQCGKYYTASEFEISHLTNVSGEIMELGRSCVHKDYRTKPTIQLLWRWLSSIIELQEVVICFGCASFTGVNIDNYAQAFSYLYYNHLAPEDLRARALPHLYQKMNILPRDQVDNKAALKQLPPLIKGYLRLGGFVGEGVIIDHQFNTIDVCIIVQRKLTKKRYSELYKRNDSSQQNGVE